MNKTPLFFLIAIILVLISASSLAFAQSNQNLILKPGFNFVSFSVTPTVSAAAFKSANPAIENIFVYSAAAGSFLSVNEGTLTTLAAGKGYIVKNSNTSDLTISIPGSVPATIGNINLKTGFNLIGFAKTPAAVTFNKLMDVYPIIKGLYKWSTSAGGFIQVIRNESGVPVQLDGINPSFKAGESYFINMAGDTTLNYDGADVIVGSGPPPVAVAKTFEVSGPIGSALKTPYLTSISRLIDNTGYRISIFDEINNQPLEDSTVSFIAADTYRAVIKTASTTKYASIIIKNLENKVVYKIFLGRIPKSEEISDSSIKVTNLRIDDSSTAKAIVFISYKEKIPGSALIANKSLDASIEETVFMKETKYSFGNINSIVIVLERVTSVIRGVLAKDSIESYIRDFVEVSTYNSLGNTLNAYVKLISFYDYLSYKQNISIPSLINIGNVVIKEGSTSETVQAALSEAGLLINKSVLKNIELDKVTDSVLIGKQYDLSLINAMAVYSDNFRKKIIPYWKVQSGQGTVWVNNGQWVFDAPIGSSETVLCAGYDEDGGAVTRSAQLTLRIVSDKPVIVYAEKLALSMDTDSITVGEIYDFSKIKTIAYFSDGKTSEVTVTWVSSYDNLNPNINDATTARSAVSGLLTKNSYCSGDEDGGLINFRADYSFGGNFVSGWFGLYVKKNDVISKYNLKTFRTVNITSAGSKLYNSIDNTGNYNAAVLEIPPNSITGADRLSLNFASSYHPDYLEYGKVSHDTTYYSSLYYVSVGTFTETDNVSIKNARLTIPLDVNDSTNSIYVEQIDLITGVRTQIPFTIEKRQLSPSLNTAHPDHSLITEVITYGVVIGVAIGYAYSTRLYKISKATNTTPVIAQPFTGYHCMPYYDNYPGYQIQTALLILFREYGISDQSIYQIAASNPMLSGYTPNSSGGEQVICNCINKYLGSNCTYEKFTESIVDPNGYKTFIEVLNVLNTALTNLETMLFVFDSDFLILVGCNNKNGVKKYVFHGVNNGPYVEYSESYLENLWHSGNLKAFKNIPGGGMSALNGSLTKTIHMSKQDNAVIFKNSNNEVYRIVWNTSLPDGYGYKEVSSGTVIQNTALLKSKFDTIYFNGISFNDSYAQNEKFKIIINGIFKEFDFQGILTASGNSYKKGSVDISIPWTEGQDNFLGKAYEIKVELQNSTTNQKYDSFKIKFNY